MENNLAPVRSNQGRFYQRAFTMNELLVILAVVGVIGLLPALARPRVTSSRIHCANNLKNVGLAFRIFATDNDDKFPMQLSTNAGGAREWTGSGTNTYRIYQSLSNELYTPTLVHCRTDTRPRATGFVTLVNSNISYFVALDAVEKQPNTILAGDRNIRANITTDQSAILALRTNKFIGWTKQMHYSTTTTKRILFGQIQYTVTTQPELQGNIVMADGSVRQVNDQGLLDIHRKTGLVTNRFALPE